MIDCEAEIFTRIATAFRAAYPDGYIAGEYVSQPPKFPAVSIEEMDNSVLGTASDSGAVENYASVVYEVNVYSNRVQGKKAECKAIAALIDREFERLNFTRTFLNPVPNYNDSTIFRMTGRYAAVVAKDETIYRR